MGNDAILRIGAFAMTLVVMAIGETMFPRKQLTTPKKARWISNLSISGISTILSRILVPIAPISLAILASERSIGLFNIIDLPLWVSVPLSVLIFDMVIYFQHVAFHQNLPLWRIHRMHHADLDIDASTGIRFHPIEIFLSMLIKLIVVAIIGPPAIAVLIFEILLNSCALFNHANLYIPSNLDRILRLFIVTPDMHRVHHSTKMKEANMNYGFNFPWWDRFFGTYKDQPDLGHEKMQIGLNIFREPKFISLWQMLLIPFK